MSVDLPTPAGARGTMHASEPEGRDFLRWLYQAGGHANGKDYTPATGRMHPNNGAASAKWWLARLGVADAENAVSWTNEGKTERGLVIGVYRMRADVAELMRFGLLFDTERALGLARKATQRRGGVQALF